MLKAQVLLLCFVTSLFHLNLFAQTDSSLLALQNIPGKYISSVDKKINKYSERVTVKTEKTLKKLAKWEEKIKGILLKVNPEAANKLFGNDQLTFTSLLQKIKSGQATALRYHAQYDKYRDDLFTRIKYLEKNKEYLDSTITKNIRTSKKRLEQFNEWTDSTEAIEQFIKERKKQLLQTAFRYLGKNKYLSKISKQAWYYSETVKNYKDILQDEDKIEDAVKEVLGKVPGFQKFMQKNSMLASLFGDPSAGVANAAVRYTGLQTRDEVQGMLQQRIAAGGEGAQQIVKNQIQAAQAQLNQYKDKLVKALPGAGSGDDVMPDFKPNMQKTKTFLQRIEWGSDIQFAKNNSLLPTTMDVALTVGYKLNDKSIAGLGGSYKLGLGSTNKINFSTQGISLRSFMDWKLKKQFFISGGFEMNYISALPEIVTSIQPVSGNWQKSALAGITKKIKVKTKFFKQTKLQLLYDFLAKQHLPVSQPILFRVGYNF